MGEYADMMLDGTCCSMCGEFLNDGADGDGFPVTCVSCGGDGRSLGLARAPRLKSQKRIEGKKRRRRAAAARKVVARHAACATGAAPIYFVAFLEEDGTPYAAVFSHQAAAGAFAKGVGSTATATTIDAMVPKTQEPT